MVDNVNFAEKLALFFRQKMHDVSCVEVQNCQPVTGGYNCVMTSFTLIADGVSRQLLSRADTPSSTMILKSDRKQEWETLEALTKHTDISMPSALYYDDGSVLGSKTIILDYIESESFLSLLRKTGHKQRPAQTQMFASLCAKIHGVDLSILPSTLERPTDWHAYIDQQIAHWKQAEKNLSQSFPMIRYIAAWLDTNRPKPTELTLVHGEFQTSNLIYGQDQKLYAVDWEFAHIGDPREDLGWASWVESVLPPMLIAEPSVDNFCQIYREYSGLDETVINPLTLAFFSVLPAIKIFEGVLAQQQDFSKGLNENINNGYLMGAVVGAFDEWFKAVEQIDAAKSKN